MSTLSDFLEVATPDQRTRLKALAETLGQPEANRSLSRALVEAALVAVEAEPAPGKAYARGLRGEKLKGGK